MKRLYWHKSQPVTLGPKLEALTNDHPSKPECLFQLSRLFHAIGNCVERKRLLTLVSELSRERGDDHRLAQALIYLSQVHLNMGLYEEGIRLAKEASEVSERLGDVVEQASAVTKLGWLFYYRRSSIPRYRSPIGETNNTTSVTVTASLARYIVPRTIRRSPSALGIASSFNGLNLLFWTRFDLAELFVDQVSLTMPMLTSSTPTCTRSATMTHTLWLAQWSHRFRFGIGKVGSRRPSLKGCVLSMRLRSLGPREMRSARQGIPPLD